MYTWGENAEGLSGHNNLPLPKNLPFPNPQATIITEAVSIGNLGGNWRNQARSTRTTPPLHLRILTFRKPGTET